MFQLPLVFVNKPAEGTACKKPQMGSVQQAFFPVLEFALHQFCDQSAVGSVRYRDQQLASRGQKRSAGIHNALRSTQMLQYICANDVVVLLMGKMRREIAGFQVVDNHGSVVRARVLCLCLAPSEAVTYARLRLSQIFT